jgi:hypothetical protein
VVRKLHVVEPENILSLRTITRPQARLRCALIKKVCRIIRWSPVSRAFVLLNISAVWLAGGFRNVLHNYLNMRPGTEYFTALNKYVYFEDANVVVIYDGFPKSTFHLLLMVKPQSPLLHANAKCQSTSMSLPNGIQDLRPHHLQALCHLHRVAEDIKEHIGSRNIKLGYHAGLQRLQYFTTLTS